MRLSCRRLLLLLVLIAFIVGFYFVKSWYDKKVGVSPYQTVQKIISLDQFKTFLHNLKPLMIVYALTPINTFYIINFKLELLGQENDFGEVGFIPTYI